MLIVMFVFYTIVNIKLYWYCANYIREWRDHAVWNTISACKAFFVILRCKNYKA
jgi:hypothetical protein